MSILDFERILITGGSGFIGRALVNSLVARGLRPMIADRSARENDSGGAYQIARIDITDHKAVTRLIEDYRPNLTFHLAGGTLRNDVTGQFNDELNYAATVSLLENLVDCRCQKAVLMSTAAEYGDNPTPFREDMPSRPVSAYARSKAKATKFAIDLHDRTGFDVTVLRTFTAFGPGQPANMFLSQLVSHAVLNQPFNMSDGTQRRDFVFIDDVVDALLAAVEIGKASGRVVNIGTGTAITLRSAAEYVWSACDADREKLVLGSVPKTGDDPLDTLADVSLAANLLGWQPVTSFESGIGRMIQAERLKQLEGPKYRKQPFENDGIDQ